jgi:predicted deacylase
MSDALPAWTGVASGTRTTLTVGVTSRADGSAIALPVMVVRGTANGPTLLVSAGVHGDEFEGMRALQVVFEGLQPDALRGTFVGVPVANPPAFEAGLRVNPDDRLDLARVFPGDRHGTVTEQIAHVLTHAVIRHADLFCDLHSAGQYYAMPPLCGYSLYPEPLLTVQRKAARAFGLPLIWGTPPLPGRSLSAAADFQVPAIYAEITGEGRCRPADVNRYAAGIRGLLGHLGITDDTAGEGEPRVIEDRTENAGFLQRQMRAPIGGLFDPAVRPGETVQPGQPIGAVRDPVGGIRHTALAPHAGIVVFLRTFSRVLAGDPLCCVLETRE